MTAETFLLMAERHFVEGELRVSRQLAQVARLEASGKDAGVARGVLEVLEKTLASMGADLHLAHHRAR